MRQRLKDMFFEAEDFLDAGNMSLAIKTYLAALKYAKKDDAEEYFAWTFLGMAYDDSCNIKSARECFQKAQSVAASTFGKTSAQFAVALSNEAMLDINLDRPAAVENLIDTAISILESAESEGSLTPAEFIDDSILEVYANAGTCKGKLGKFVEAAKHIKSAYDRANAIFPVGHPRRLQAAIEMEAAYNLLGKRRESKKIRDEITIMIRDQNASPLELALSMLGALQGIEDATSEIQEFSSLSPKLTGKKQQAKKQQKGESAVSNVIPLFGGQAGASHPTNSYGYQLKITLQRVKPPVWRRIVVPAAISLAALHEMVQEAMGWTDSHLHEFRLGDVRFGDRRQMPELKDEKKYDLSDLGLVVGSKLEYTYDFGDGWMHSIQVEKLLDKDTFDRSEVFVTGKGACPPEDCGGPWGFMGLLAEIEKHGIGSKKLPEWLDDYDPQQLPEVFPVKTKATRPGAKTKPVKKSRSNPSAVSARKVPTYKATKVSSKPKFKRS